MAQTPPRRRKSAQRAFITSEAAGGLVLIAATLLAMLIANLPGLSGDYFHLLHAQTGPVLSARLGPMTTHLWINDGLMAVFFLLVGLEIKRELTDGELASLDKRRLPIVAAAAGMIVPAIVYLAVVRGDSALIRGWAIPAATDIAFAIGVLTLLGRYAPAPLRLFLTTVAIVDDMGAVAIIAVAYTEAIDWIALAGAALVIGGMILLNRRRVTALWPYLLGFALLWLFILQSGIHATIAGVVTAMLVPVTKSPGAPDADESPLHRLEHALNPWVAFVIVPVFAFANAGVSLAGVSLAVMLAQPLVIAIAAGLFVGKQMGILGGIALAERLKIARRPKGVSWTQLYGVALIAGIGFTMSLFIGGLAFPGSPQLQDEVKIGVLIGSVLSALGGVIVLRFMVPKPKGKNA
jgi:NhaA family Na+:H+ antiporter